VAAKGLQQGPQPVGQRFGAQQRGHERARLGGGQPGKAHRQIARLHELLGLAYQGAVRAGHFGAGHQHQRHGGLERHGQ
jgi:hypothetical protein